MSSNNYSGPKFNTMTIFSVLAAFIVPPVGVVLAYIARRQIRATGERGYRLTDFALSVGFILSFFYLIGLVFGWQAVSALSGFMGG